MSTKEIREIYTQISQLQDRIQEIAGDREDRFLEKSERWQESEKGQEYERMTELLNEVHESLDNAGGGLLEFLGE